MNFVVISILVLLLAGWFVTMAFPGWNAIHNSWPKRKEYRNIFRASVVFFAINIALIFYLVWLVVFSEPWDTNGLVTLSAFILLPPFTLVVTLPIYYVFGKYAVREGAWVQL